MHSIVVGLDLHFISVLQKLSPLSSLPLEPEVVPELLCYESFKHSLQGDRKECTEAVLWMDIFLL